MKCPIDNETLVITTREGIEIDYCPKCRGIWLDRGELDKLIERSVAQLSAARRDDDDDYDRDYRRKGKHHGAKPYRKKRKSIFEELFDF